MNYRNFVKSISDCARRETFNVGSCKQFVLCNEPEKYHSFGVRNVYANGKVWDGDTGVYLVYFLNKATIQK